ncbi:metal-sensitive transcriptional regulator (plasmid) [Deinococcus taeanensis]|uniref:metal-sensitive transcriptional regulator n=1 Tax=Deinococcus taeanensis TaxID=2737050 RepID=UPI001CDC04C1|nr:metal-sensitive transcriptional regulator [Deinococcus taeanensis]UBV44152.1 metal-sensitive transcriptional regulator [Deinococcus taeanensis]
MTSPAPLSPNDKEKQRVLNRLRRLEGQVRGLHKMVEDERPCQEILTLLSGVRSALDATGEAIFEQYLLSCAAEQGEPLPTKEIVKTARLLR